MSLMSRGNDTMRLEHHLVGGYVRYISPHIIIIIIIPAFPYNIDPYFFSQSPSWPFQFGYVECADQPCQQPFCKFPVKPSGECCPICDDCFYTGRFYRNRETFPDPEDRCRECVCVVGGINHFRVASENGRREIVFSRGGNYWLIIVVIWFDIHVLYKTCTIIILYCWILMRLYMVYTEDLYDTREHLPLLFANVLCSKMCANQMGDA